MYLLPWLKAVGKHLWALMSCAVFTVIGLWAAYASKSNEWTVRAIFAGAGLCLLVACYLAWADKHEKLLQFEEKYLHDRPKMGLNAYSTEGPTAWREQPVPVTFTLQHLSGRIPTSVQIDPVPSKLGKFSLHFDPVAHVDPPVQKPLFWEIVETGASPISAVDREKTANLEKEMLLLFLRDSPNLSDNLEYHLVAHFMDGDEAGTQTFRLVFETGKYRFSSDTALNM